MSTPSIILTVILSFLLLIVPKRFFLFPFIMAACFAPMNQRIALLNLDFTLLRILIIFGILRLATRKEARNISWNKFDKILFLWSVIGSFVYIVQQANFSAVINKSGVMFDTLGMYWLFRQIIKEWDDVFQTVHLFAFFAIITAPLIFMEESQGGHASFFALFGPVESTFHRGRFRAAGPFPHYIMMGCFWASLLPMFFASIKSKRWVILSWLAIFAALSNVYSSGSSTPFLTVIAIVFFWLIHRFRQHGKIIFASICLCILFLHLIMKAPVWHLLARLNFFSGSTGWHRYFTFDVFVNNISNWFLMGTKSYELWDTHGIIDITNQFVLEGVRGGMITLLFFTTLIYYAVSIPGRISLSDVPSEVRWLNWGLCVSMLGHFVTFWGVAYFGQINLLLILSFAFVGFALEKNEKLHQAIV